MGEHAFPLTGFVCMVAQVSFGAADLVAVVARPEQPYPCNSLAKSQDFSEGEVK